jgi:hypothetical protein
MEAQVSILYINKAPRGNRAQKNSTMPVTCPRNENFAKYRLQPNRTHSNACIVWSCTCENSCLVAARCALSGPSIEAACSTPSTGRRKRVKAETGLWRSNGRLCSHRIAYHPVLNVAWMCDWSIPFLACRLSAGYLFPVINKKKQEFLAANPDAKLISLGIGLYPPYILPSLYT